MFAFLSQTFGPWPRSAGARKAGSRASVPRSGSRPQCETLEDRMLLSVSGAQLFANSLPTSAHAVVAGSPAGPSVVAWQEPIGALHDIHAQIFDAAGHKVGGDILVAGNRENQYDPTVAVNASGEFAIAWTMDFSPTDTDVHAALFGPGGSLRAADFDVAATWKREFAPSAGIDARGDFVISYTLQFGPSDQDVKAALFDADANLVRTSDVAVSTRVENDSHVGMNPDGSFAVAYLSDGAPMVRHFTAVGAPLDAGISAPVQPPAPVTPPAGTEVSAQGVGGSGSSTPHQIPALSGTLAGGYVPAATAAGKGTRYDLVGIGSLTGMGEVTATGSLLSTGAARSSDATGVLTLQGAQGTVTLSLVGPTQGAFAALPSQFHSTITSATGAYSHLHSGGIINLRLIPASHTLALDLVPQAQVRESTRQRFSRGTHQPRALRRSSRPPATASSRPA